MTAHPDTFEAALLARQITPEDVYTCACCPRTGPADFFRRTDDLPWPTEPRPPFACVVCVSGPLRERQAAEEAAAPWPTAEQLNDLRAQRDTALLRSDWTQLADNAARLTPDQRDAWTAYRQQWRDLVAAAKEGQRLDPPSPPE